MLNNQDGKIGWISFGPWEFRSRSSWCYISCVAAPEMVLWKKIPLSRG